MKSKKLLSILLASALVAGFVTFNACNDDPDYAEEGKKAAQEWCDCLNNAQNETAKDACFSIIENKYASYLDINAFKNAYYQGIESCDRILAYLGTRAAQDLCECFAGTVDDEGKWACVFGLQATIYGNFMEDETFGEAFTIKLMAACPDVLAWLYENGFGGE